MSTLLTAVKSLDTRLPDGPVHRSIVAVDIEGSTKRTNPVKGELRRILYEVMDRALGASGIADKHLEQLTDRGDGVLILIRPHDDLPKTVLFASLVPALTALLIDHNTTVIAPALQLRLRAVIHAGEVHDDGRGFYGEDLDVAFRLMDSPTVKKVLKAVRSPLVLVISDEIFTGIVRHGYVSGGLYEPIVRVRVADRQHRGWVHVPAADPDRLAGLRLASSTSPSSTISSMEGRARNSA